MSDDHRRSRPDLCVPTVHLLGSFALHVGADTIPLPVDSRRLVAYLAVHPRPQPTAALAADLWPGVTPSAAARLLDEAVAAVDVPGLLVGDDQGRLSLGESAATDLSDAMLLIRALSGIRVEQRPDTELLESDILPSWTASWIAVERERFRQLRLSAMESLSAGLTAADQHDDAVAVARRVVAAAPSRERSRRVLVEAMLAGGDVSGAMAEYEAFQELLRSSIGATTDSELDRLLAPLESGWPLGPGLHRPVQRWSVGMPGVRGGRPAGRRLAAGSPASGR